MISARIKHFILEDRTHPEETAILTVLLALLALWVSGAVGVYADYQKRMQQQAIMNFLAQEEVADFLNQVPQRFAAAIPKFDNPEQERAVEPVKAIAEGAVFADLRGTYDRSVFQPSLTKNTHQGAFYAGPFLAENLVETASNLSLLIKLNKTPERPSMAELRTPEHYGYGRYEAIMRPSGDSGTVSAFFTYTGAPFGDPHDEVDIEFVGARSDQVEFNYFKNGRRGAYTRVALGFDAADAMNLYAFDWLPDKIIWYVNGEEVYRTHTDGDDIPIHPGKIYISAWTGIEQKYAWTGRPDFEAQSQADFECISYTPVGKESWMCADQWAARTTESRWAFWPRLRRML